MANARSSNLSYLKICVKLTNRCQNGRKSVVELKNFVMIRRISRMGSVWWAEDLVKIPRRIFLDFLVTLRFFCFCLIRDVVLLSIFYDAIVHAPSSLVIIWNQVIILLFGLWNRWSLLNGDGFGTMRSMECWTFLRKRESAATRQWFRTPLYMMRVVAFMIEWPRWRHDAFVLPGARKGELEVDSKSFNTQKLSTLEPTTFLAVVYCSKLLLPVVPTTSSRSTWYVVSFDCTRKRLVADTCMLASNRYVGTFR